MALRPNPSYAIERDRGGTVMAWRKPVQCIKRSMANDGAGQKSDDSYTEVARRKPGRHELIRRGCFGRAYVFAFPGGRQAGAVRVE